jgi:hypothetical protein
MMEFATQTVEELLLERVQSVGVPSKGETQNTKSHRLRRSRHY